MLRNKFGSRNSKRSTFLRQRFSHKSFDSSSQHTTNFSKKFVKENSRFLEELIDENLSSFDESQIGRAHV